jgi:hypothetical protein
MIPKPKVPAIGEALRGTVAYAVRSREGLRAGLRDAHAARLHAPTAEEHARRFLFGLTLPVTLMRVAWTNAEIKRSIVRRLLPPLACVALFAVVGIASMTEDLVAARHQPLALTAHVDDDDDDGESIQNEDDVKAAVVGVASAVKASKDRGAADLEASAAAVSGAAEKLRVAKEAARAKANVAAKPERFPVLHAVLEFVESRVAKLIGILSVVEWILVWIGREHHDQIAYDVSRLTGVPGEPLAGPPRLRFDLAWPKLKAWRALRFFIFVGLGSPVAWIVGKVPHAGESLVFVVEGAWAAYWACVFGIGNSFLVWEKPAGPDEAPWFIRGLRQAARVPVLGLPFALYARILTMATRNVWPACMAFERTAWESMGLAALRGLASIPVVYIITRPMFSPAATHAFIARAPVDSTSPYRGAGAQSPEEGAAVT